MLDLLNRIAQFLVGAALLAYLAIRLALGLYVGFTD